MRTSPRWTLMAAPIVGGGVTLQNFRAVREERLKLVAELEKDTSASAMKAYFFIAPVLSVARLQGAQAHR